MGASSVIQTQVPIVSSCTSAYFLGVFQTSPSIYSTAPEMARNECVFKCFPPKRYSLPAKSLLKSASVCDLIIDHRSIDIDHAWLPPAVIVIRYPILPITSAVSIESSLASLAPSGNNSSLAYEHDHGGVVENHEKETQ